MGEILILGHKILCDLALASLWNQLSPLALTDSALATWSPCVSLNLSSTLLLEGCFTCCIFLKCFSSIWLHGLLSDFIQFCFHVIWLESFPEHPIEKGTLSASTLDGVVREQVWGNALHQLGYTENYISRKTLSCMVPVPVNQKTCVRLKSKVIQCPLLS